MKKRTRSNRTARRVLVMALIAVLTLTLAPPALAGEYITDNSRAVVDEGEVIEDDLFISAQYVEMNGTVEGDLFATGEYVVVNGVVEGNLFASGAIIVLGGEVQGAAFVGGYALQLQPETALARNLYFGGYSLEAIEGSQIGRSLYGGGYQFLMNGMVGRDVTVGASAFRLNGSVEGDMLVDVATPRYSEDMIPFLPMYYEPPMEFDFSMPALSPGLDIEDGTIGGEFEQRVTYYDAGPNVNFQTPDFRPEVFLANRVRARVGELVGLLLIGSLMLYLASSLSEKVAKQVSENPWPSLGWGALAFLLYIPVIVVLIFLLALVVLLLSMLTLGQMTGTAISVAGLGFMGFTTVFSLVAAWVAKVVVSFIIGREIIKRLFPEAMDGSWGKFWALLTGLLIYETLRFVPVLGGFVAVVFIVLGVGAVFALLWQSYQSSRSVPVVVE